MKSKYAHKIGIGITTHNRPEVFAYTFLQIKRHLPRGAKVVVVDDASDRPASKNPRIGVQTKSNVGFFRFNENVGIATAKNKCLELLDDCEHIFLFDDDCFPRVSNWHIPYIESPEPHLMYLFINLRHHKLNDAELVYQDSQHFAISHARGCMLYFHRSVLDIAGGMDTEYGKWGFEHGDLSNRIYNLGLTTFRYMDVQGSGELIYSKDEEQKVGSSVSGKSRSESLQRYKNKFDASFSASNFFPYKDGAKQKLPKSGKKNVIITSYFNAVPDVQRNKKWPTDYRKLIPLKDSVVSKKIKIAIIHNCFKIKDTRFAEHVHASQGANPYFQRWLSQWQYLRDNPDVKQCFITDSTDVVMLNDPFQSMVPGILYVGDEKNRVGCPWMRKSAVHRLIKQFVAYNFKKILYNCGVVGGSREDVMRLCRMLYEQYFEVFKSETVEMPLFNKILHMQWPADKIVYGRQVTTVFKGHEKVSTAWFKHK